MRVLLCDNYDSFTHILGHYIWIVTGAEPKVLKNDDQELLKIKSEDYDVLVLSPGPGNPKYPSDIGHNIQLIKTFSDKPILGVCLGHQILAQYFGAEIQHLPEERHGKNSTINMEEADPIFQNISRKEFSVTRYHSLDIHQSTMPSCLKTLSRTRDDQSIMIFKHIEKYIYGMQFHPESIGTEYGLKLLQNFFRGIGSRSFSHHRSHDVTKKDLVTATKMYFHVQEEQLADPVQIYESISLQPYSFWLDSNEPSSAKTGYSIIGYAESVHYSYGAKVFSASRENNFHSQQIHWNQTVLDYYQSLLGQKEIEIDSEYESLPFTGGLLGFFSYEFKEQLGYDFNAQHQKDLPGSLFMWVQDFYILDHENDKLLRCHISQNREYLFPLIETSSTLSNDIPQSNEYQTLDDEHSYKEKITRIKQCLRNGESYEACLTSEYQIAYSGSGFPLYKKLRDINPAQYSSYIKTPGFEILSSSPENFFSLDASGKIISEPIKGTRKRTGKLHIDELELEDLKNSPKDKSELLMITDLIRNDLAKICEPGSVKVPITSTIKELETVYQQYSKIHGKVRKGINGLDVIHHMFPGGSITGCPKHRTIQILDQLEKRPRGIYTGSIGYLSLNGNSQFNIAIRTMFLKDGTIKIGSGGAIVSDSIPEKEYEEIQIKAAALLKTLGFSA